MIVGRKYCRTECSTSGFFHYSTATHREDSVSYPSLFIADAASKRFGAEAAFDGTKLKIGVMDSAVPVSLCGRPAEGL